MINSEKDSILEDALGIIVTEFVEISLINKDHTGWYALLERTVINRSISTFMEGIKDFYDGIKSSENPSDINSMHMRFMIRCINSERIMLAANQIYTSVEKNLLVSGFDITYDMFKSGAIVEMSLIDRVMLLIHIYNDRISIGVLANSVASNKK